jgi:CYTH domain-containing protein
VRTELEWPITSEQFDRCWPHTAERRVHKTRHLVPLHDGVTAELDEFHDELDGLLLVEVEFTSDDQMHAFEPPEWFGREVTDDPSYRNSMLAVRGRP